MHFMHACAYAGGCVAAMSACVLMEARERLCVGLLSYMRPAFHSPPYPLETGSLTELDWEAGGSNAQQSPPLAFSPVPAPLFKATDSGVICYLAMSSQYASRGNTLLHLSADCELRNDILYMYTI